MLLCALSILGGENIFKVIFSLGSNIEPEENINLAISEIRKTGGKIVRISSGYLTAPVGGIRQPDFLNLLVLAGYNLAFSEPVVISLFNAIKIVEKKLGRKEGVKWGPREIDIDIISIEDNVMDLPELKIPHRQLSFRLFNLLPLREIMPGFINPISKLSIDEMLKNILHSCQTVKRIL